MILAFTGDPFLAREGLLQEARLQGLSPRLLPPQPALVAQEAFYDLDAPVERIGAMDVPVPFSPVLEDLTIPTVQQVVDAGRRVMSNE